jgi:hypothetical protein
MTEMSYREKEAIQSSIQRKWKCNVEERNVMRNEMKKLNEMLHLYMCEKLRENSNEEEKYNQKMTLSPSRSSMIEKSVCQRREKRRKKRSSL